MKILFATHYFQPHVGGIEIVAYNQAKELVKKGHEVTIISSRVGREKKEEIIDGIKIKRVDAWNFFERKWGIPYPVFSPKLFLAMNREAKKADIVHVHDFFYLSSFAGALAAWLWGKPLFLMQHVKNVKHSKVFVNFVQKAVYILYGKFIVDFSKKIFVCNEEVGFWLNKNEKTHFLANSVDPFLFKPLNNKLKILLRKKYNLPIDKKIVLFVGRFVEVKGFDKLFEAKDKEYLILFVGEGVVPSYMKKDSNVIFLKSVNQRKLKEIYQLSDLFCLPSKSEGFPLTVLEAMASGLPIILSDLPVYHTHFDEKKIIIVKPTPENLKKSIKKIIQNPFLGKKMREYSRNSAEEKFGWTKNVESLLKIYNETKPI